MQTRIPTKLQRTRFSRARARLITATRSDDFLRPRISSPESYYTLVAYLGLIVPIERKLFTRYIAIRDPIQEIMVGYKETPNGFTEWDYTTKVW